VRCGTMGRATAVALLLFLSSLPHLPRLLRFRFCSLPYLLHTAVTSSSADIRFRAWALPYLRAS